MLVFVELGKVLASVPLLGHLPATFVLDRAGADAGLLAELAARRGAPASSAPSRRSDVEARWTVARRSAARERGARPARRRRGCRTRRAPTCSSSSARATAALCRGRRRGGRAGDALRRDALARPRARRPARAPRSTSAEDARQRLVPASALLAAESLGAVERALEMSRRLREGALHLRARDRLLPGDEAPARRDPAAARQRRAR